MRKFEYKQIAYLDVLDHGKSVEPKKFGENSEMEALHHLGSEGWELVTIENSEFVVYYFKRELK